MNYDKLGQDDRKADRKTERHKEGTTKDSMIKIWIYEKNRKTRDKEESLFLLIEF